MLSATPGHTADHISVLVDDGDTTYFLAGDTSYTEDLMLAGSVDGVTADEDVSRATLDAIRGLTKDRPTVYLPTHDPQSGYSASASQHGREPRHAANGTQAR